MVCKKCGCNIEKGWKYCPNCSNDIYKNQKIIIISIVALAVVICAVLFVIKNNMPVNEKYIKNYLKKKYDEKFESVSFVKSVKNEDVVISCDGSSFTPIKGKGETDYYKVYSNKNDIEFIASYDNSSKSKKINDSYEESLKKRTTLVEAYNIISKYLRNLTYEVKLLGNSNKVNISSESQLKNLLSKYEEKNEDLKEFEIYINENLYYFCKVNYVNINKINDEIVALQKTNDYEFSTTIMLNSSSRIGLHNGEVYIYEKSGTPTGTLDEYLANN